MMIRTLMPNEYESLLTIGHTSDVIESVSTDMHVVYGVFEELELVGSLVVQDCSKDALYSNMKDVRYIQAVRIEDSYRHKGYGTFLLRNVLEILMNGGIKIVFLNVYSDNIIAMNLYKKVGFVKLSVKEDVILFIWRSIWRDKIWIENQL